MNRTTLTGCAAIKYAVAHGVLLNKYQDLTEDGRIGLTVQDAREIATEDPSLIWVRASVEWAGE